MKWRFSSNVIRVEITPKDEKEALLLEELAQHFPHFRKKQGGFSFFFENIEEFDRFNLRLHKKDPKASLKRYPKGALLI
jgi:hypothetical protein